MASSEDNPARPAPGLRLGHLAELADPGSKGFRFRADQWLFAGFLVRNGDAVTGFVDSCPHAAWPLAALDDRYLTRGGEHILCSGHGARFTLDGACIAGPCAGQGLASWPVTVRDGVIYTA